MIRRFTLAALFLALSSCAASAPGTAPAQDARAAPAVQRATVSSMPADAFGPLVSRRAIHGGRSSFASFEFKKGAVVPEHRHPNEQTTYVLSGRMVFHVAGERHELSAGDVLIIPPDVPHDARALEDTVEIDFFTPERRDWLDGSDAYLRRLGGERPAGAPALEVVARLDAPPGNIAVSPDGRRFVSMHPFGKPVFKVLEVLPDGRTRPFPNERWSRSPASGSDAGMHAVIGIRADARGVVWMLDLGAAGAPPRLIGWNTRQDRLERTVKLPAAVAASNSFFQDFALDQTHGAAFIADMTRGDLFGPSDPAIVAVDLATGDARRLLAGHPSLAPDGARMIIDGAPVTGRRPDGELAELELGLNPITIDARDEWVYYGAMHGASVYRVRTADLLDRALSPAALAARVERVGEKGVSDGITIDAGGNVYVTDVNRHAIGVLRASGGYETLLTDPEVLAWPDGFGSGPDGYIYVTANQLHRTAPLHGGVDASRPPYLIARFRPLAPPVVGR